MTKVSEWIAVGGQYEKPLEDVRQRYECRNGETLVASLQCTRLGRWTLECRDIEMGSVVYAMDRAEKILKSLGYEIALEEG